MYITGIVLIITKELDTDNSSLKNRISFILYFITTAVIILLHFFRFERKTHRHDDEHGGQTNFRDGGAATGE